MRSGGSHSGFQAVGRRQRLSAQGVALHVAPVKDRQAQADFIAPLRCAWPRVFKNGVALEAQLNVRETGDCVQPLGLCCRVQGRLRQTDVQTTCAGLLCDLFGLMRLFRQFRQTFRQFQLLGLLIVETQQPDQLFAGGPCLLLGARQTGRRVGIERLVSCARQFVEVSHHFHAPRQLRTGLGAEVNLMGIFHGLLCGHSTHPRLPHQGHLINYVTGQTELRLLHALVRNALALWQRQQVKQAECQGPLNIQSAAKDDALEVEYRVGDAA
ncbi:MAG: hypothetical protein BWZ07_03301 [Alphaproteobacteria bacterium ADurb.BinA280]|nr:MAG: hypothetical protein BWZ07_03301 [Alphaproteobacteria bacterium ADurb.BinA280]